MKSPYLGNAAPIAAAFLFLILGSATVHAQGRGAGGGTPGLGAPPVDLYRPLSLNRTFNDLELTAITRMEENAANGNAVQTVAALAAKATEARTALVEASLTLPTDSRVIQAKATALGEAEVALANARAGILKALIKKELPGSDAAKIQAVANAMETRAIAQARAAATRAANAAAAASMAPAASPATAPGRAGRAGQ